MDINSLHTQLRSGQLSSFYVFAGPEWAVQKIYIDQIVKTSGLSMYRAETFTEVFRKISSPGLISKKYVFILRDDKELLKEEKAQAKLKPEFLKKNILILLLTTVDKRTKFFKAYKDTIVEFEPLKPAILKKYLQKEIDLSDRNIDKLMEVCEYSYGRCLLEIDKIRRYANARNLERY